MVVQRYFWGVLFALLAFGAFLQFLAILPIVGEDWSIFKWFFCGAISYVILTGLANSIYENNFKFLRTFTHELTHTIFTFLSFKSVRHFEATSHKGGEIHVVGGGNMLILLSPYCIPIFTLALLLTKPLFQLQFVPYIEGAIGFTYLFHLQNNWLQTNNRQTDIKKYPYFTAYAFIVLFQLLFLGVILLNFKVGMDAFVDVGRGTLEKLWFTVLHFQEHPIGGIGMVGEMNLSFT